MKSTKEVKGWAVYDLETNSIGRYKDDGEYMISTRKYKRGELHDTFKCIPVTISFSLPK